MQWGQSWKSGFEANWWSAHEHCQRERKRITKLRGWICYYPRWLWSCWITRSDALHAVERQRWCEVDSGCRCRQTCILLQMNNAALWCACAYFHAKPFSTAMLHRTAQMTFTLRGNSWDSFTVPIEMGGFCRCFSDGLLLWQRHVSQYQGKETKGIIAKDVNCLVVHHTLLQNVQIKT